MDQCVSVSPRRYLSPLAGEENKKVAAARLETVHFSAPPLLKSCANVRSLPSKVSGTIVFLFFLSLSHICFDNPEGALGHGHELPLHIPHLRLHEMDPACSEDRL